MSENVRQTSAPFALMASAALMLVVLWERSPVLSIALVGPLLAISLYQRSTFRAMRAMRLALTDPLTGLGNHRSFHERLQRELTAAEGEQGTLSVCLVDIDDFKQINDRFGHPVGDIVLGQVASRLRQGGESFRLGGDEFAVLLPGLDDRSAVAVARSIVERIGALEIDDIGSVTVSAGVATFPVQGVARDELIRLADSALYWAKEDGKNQARTYEPVQLDVLALEALSEGPDRTARYRAAASLAKAVDARDAYTGSHSERVGEIAARIARRLGIDEPQVELTRLAASLHDLGKLAIPEEILRKPAALNETERLVLERHPQIGYRMLESLGVDPIADWVLHHHERWDGSGYPNGLAGDEIPLGARIIFVADAFDAMTSQRVYRQPLSKHEALAELRRCAGTQFDPEIVRAFSRELASSRRRRRVRGETRFPPRAPFFGAECRSDVALRGERGLPFADEARLTKNGCGRIAAASPRPAPPAASFGLRLTTSNRTSTGHRNAFCTHAAASSVAPRALLSARPASVPRTHPSRPVNAWVIQLEVLSPPAARS